MENSSEKNHQSVRQPASGQHTAPGSLSSLGQFVWDFFKVFLIALLIIVPIRFYLFQPFIVNGKSMQPNFHDGEYLIIDEISYRFNQPKRGDVAVIRAPGDSNEYFIKRIIGLPNETVDISGGRVTIKNETNPEGFILDESYLSKNTATFGNLRVTLDSEHYYVLGDNRIASSDSRSFGPVSRDAIVGRVFLRAFPVQKFEKFSTPEY